jgi:hypothetical protein
VVCLAFALILVFVGTMAQVDEGLYNAQNRYFRSFLIFWGPAGSGWKIPVLPGGYLVGGVLMANLIVAQATRLNLTWKNLGLICTHLGMILLLAGQLATDLLSVESHMRLSEGEAKSYSESGSLTELAIIDPSKPDTNDEIAIPDSLLEGQSEIRHPAMPVVLRVKRFYVNSRLNRLESTNTVDIASTQGEGRQLRVMNEPPAVSMEERSVPSAVVEFLSAKDLKSLGTWLVSLYLDRPQAVSVDGKAFQIVLRPKRYYKQHSIELMKFTHDKYKGTDIPKNFASRVRVKNAVTTENREVLIYMNNPLRYGGETYYQSGFDPRDARVTILQVVRNPGWLTPYVACILVSLGLTLQFMFHLIAFAKERKTR